MRPEGKPRSPTGRYGWKTWAKRLINPWLSNGRNNFRTIEEIVAAAIEPGMSNKEKAS